MLDMIDDIKEYIKREYVPTEKVKDFLNILDNLNGFVIDNKGEFKGSKYISVGEIK